VREDYIDRGYTFLHENFTMRGGEIDLIFVQNKVLIFVEVKVVNHIDELHGYVTKKKLHYVYKTMQYFLLQEGDKYKDFTLRLDVAFVKW
jgi:Holliday junction resolvase-like predicted endonuclease